MPKLTQKIMKTSYSGFFIDDIVRIYSWPPIISYHMYIHFSQHIPALSATILTNPQAAFEEGTLTENAEKQGRFLCLVCGCSFYHATRILEHSKNDHGTSTSKFLAAMQLAS